MSLATRTILTTLSLERLRTLARDFDAEHLWPMTKGAAIENLEKCPAVTVQALLDMMLFDELEKICKVLGLDGRAYRREVLITRILEADGARSDPPRATPIPRPEPPPLAAAPAAETAGGPRPAKRLHRASRPAAPPAPQA
jgi:hypothetical protein